MILTSGCITHWFKAYLIDRKQYVQINKDLSSQEKECSGVSQGSVLAPILFLLFIIDVIQNVDVSIRQFTGDCILYSEICSTGNQIRLKKSLQVISDHCLDWQMILNIEETVYISYYQQENSPSLHLQYQKQSFT